MNERRLQCPKYGLVFMMIRSHSMGTIIAYDVLCDRCFHHGRFLLQKYWNYGRLSLKNSGRYAVNRSGKSIAEKPLSLLDILEHFNHHVFLNKLTTLKSSKLRGLNFWN